MHWMIKCRSKQGTDELRSATIPAHIEHLDKYYAIEMHLPLFELFK